MALTKPPVLPPWAEAGDKVQPTNAEIQTGWPLSNTPPARQRWNWILNFLANGIRYLTRRGMPDYGADETYMIGDRVIGDDGKTYRSIQDNNSGNAPSASPLWWEEWAPSLSRLADLLQKQTYTAFTTAGAAPNFTLTPAPAITAYALGQRFRVKFHAAGTGANALNISGLGNKSLKQYNSSGAKVDAVIAANQLADVEYDGVDVVIINPLPVTVDGLVQPGSVIYTAKNTPPAGYLKANGAEVSRTTYASLFAAIGTTFGAGDGATTFKLPDLRGEFVRGWDDGRGVDSGRSFGSAQADETKSHTHKYGNTHNSNYGLSVTGIIGVNPGASTNYDTGATGGTETRPRNIALLACIKY